MNKRTFLKTSSLLGIGTLTGLPALAKFAAKSPVPAPGSDDFWESIRAGYDLKPDYINLENGFYCIQPREILNKYFEHLRFVNREGAHYLRTTQPDDKKVITERLAAVAGCSPDEIIVTRNTTESLDMIIGGQRWNPGDEAVMAEQDYGAMLEMFKLVSKRYGTVNKTISIPQDPRSDDEIVELYAGAITPRTKLVMVCHMINITGHILPVRKICEMAHKRNVKVMVDGAHTFAHLKFAIPDLDCDYFGCSLHKWLSVPLGAGLLYVKKQNIASVWPLLAEGDRKDDDITRLNHRGTIPVATEMAITDAIDFYEKIGPARKEERLRYLQNYWTGKVRKMPHVYLCTPSDPARSCAVANVGIRGVKAGDLAGILMEKYKIYTVAIDGAGVQGVRVTPNVFTTTQELDALVTALSEIKAG